MHYEITNVINPATDNWKQQQKRAQKANSRILTLAPNPGFFGLLQSEKVKGLNLIDHLTKRTYDKNSYLFFNKVPTVDGAEIFMNEDGSISIINDGAEIAQMTLYAGTRRYVKEVKYLNPDKTTDYIEEYAYDGKLFSNIFYTKNEVQRIDFFNDQQQPVVRFYRYEGAINLVTIEDPKDQSIVARYDSLNSFYTDQVAKIVKPKDTTGISYMGIELDVVAKTKVMNVLYLDESPLDDNKKIKGNLNSILNNEIMYIEKVHMSKDAYNELALQNVDLSKAEY